MHCRHNCSHYHHDWCGNDVGVAQTKPSTACTSVLLDVFRNDHSIIFHELILREIRQVKSNNLKKNVEGKREWTLYH